MSYHEKRQMLKNMMIDLIDKHNNELSKLCSDEEFYKLIRYLLAVISDNDQANILALRAYDALQDDESRRIFACLFLRGCVGIDMPLMEMILLTLKDRLMEKGNDLSNYNDYDFNFFIGEQYFSLLQLKPLCGDNEIFIDCGAYDGETIKDFVKFSEGKYEKLYSFEPNPRLYENTLQNIKNAGLQRVELIQKGVWSHEAVLNFTDNGMSSQIYDKGVIPVKVVAIDDVVPENEKVTFIKMDVEGAEFEALKGAEKTICRCRPVLAICLYHKATDIIEIPSLIMKFFPKYKFYIRHHHITMWWEAVLYALPR